MLIDLHPNFVILSSNLKDSVLKSLESQRDTRLFVLNLTYLNARFKQYIDIDTIKVQNVFQAVELLEGMCLIGYDEVRIEMWFELFSKHLEKEINVDRSGNSYEALVFYIDSLFILSKEDQARTFRLFDRITRMFYGHVNHPVRGTKKMFSEYLVIIDDAHLNLGHPMTYSSFLGYV